MFQHLGINDGYANDFLEFFQLAKNQAAVSPGTSQGDEQVVTPCNGGKIRLANALAEL